jgi:hypothetical protein
MFSGQMLAAAVQPPRLHRPVYHQRLTYLWAGQLSRRRSLSCRCHHCGRHPTTHWPHRRRATTSFEHFWRQTRLYGSRSNQFPAPQSPSTVIRPPGNLGRTSQLPYDYKCSSPSTICRTQAQGQRQSWSRSVSCGQACRRIAAPGHGLARPASAPESPATQLLQWETSRRLQPVFYTTT